MNKNKVIACFVAALFVGGLCYFGFPDQPKMTSDSAPAATTTIPTMAYRPTALGPNSESRTSAEPAKIESQGTTVEGASSDWEPIGKYSKKEIAAASAFVGELFKHQKAMDQIETKVSKALRNGYRNVDSAAIYRAVTGYNINALEEGEKIAALTIPDLENQQAADAISEALSSLGRSSDIQRKRAETLAQLATGDRNGEETAAIMKDLDLQRTAASMGLVKVFIAYRSYGFTSDAIDERTYRLKANFKPDRDVVKQ